MKHHHHHPHPHFRFHRPPGGPDGHGDPAHRHGRGPRRHGRPFDYGELRLLVLALIADTPRHGYELIKEIEDRFAGAYSPSPGVIYPTLAWADDLGYAAIEPAASGRKTYRITETGAAFLAENRALVDDILARSGEGGRGQIPPQVLRAMENVKLALRLRLRRGPVDDAMADNIAAALDAAARSVEQS